MSKKEVATKQEAAPPAVAETMEAWGQQNQMTSRDLIISKILPIQMMSKKLKDKQANYGEFRDTVNNDLLGGIGAPMEVVPFHMEKVFIEHEVDPKTNKKKFLRITPIISDPLNPGYNDELKYEEEVGGVRISRDRTLNFYVLLPSRVVPELAQAGGGTLPYIISFRRTSLRAGKKLATQMFAANAAARKAPAATVMQISGVDTSNDDGTFVVLDAAAKRPSTVEELQAAFYWYKQISKGGAKVDHSDLAEDTDVSNGAQEPEQF